MLINPMYKQATRDPKRDRPTNRSRGPVSRKVLAEQHRIMKAAIAAAVRDGRLPKL